MGAQASVKTSSQFATSGYRVMLGMGRKKKMVKKKKKKTIKDKQMAAQDI